MKILNIVGARPNFMKVAPIHKAFKAYNHVESKILHTGQHYDEKMSDIFFNQLDLPKPDFYLGVGGGSHAQVTAKIMVAFEEIAIQEKPDFVLVVGDVNSTLACALVATKLEIPLIHVEAGLRSGDRSMPEEINRILTDSMSDYLFVTEQSGMINLAKEGVDDRKVFFVGNVMIDSLCAYREKSLKLDFLDRLKIVRKEYILLTMHRPSNVDNREQLGLVVDVILDLAKHKKVVFPVHPRTKKFLIRFGLMELIEQNEEILLLEPQGYLEFLNLMDNARVIVTDSGGIQEESTFLQVPCITLRDSTERPITITLGTNILIPKLDRQLINQTIEKILFEGNGGGIIPPYWDGNAADRIAESIFKKDPDLSGVNGVSGQ